MEHLKIVGVKFLAIFVTILALFGVLHETSFMDVIIISIFTTIVSYVLGDLLVLRRAGNVNATIADFGLTFILVLVTGYMFIGYDDIPLITVSLLSAFFITCCEPFLHGYIVNRILPSERKDNRTLNQLQTEVAEEADIYDLEKK